MIVPVESALTVTTGIPPHLSEAVTDSTSEDGQCPIQAMDILLGQVMVGAMLSLTYMLWVQVAAFPQTSDAL